MPQGAGDRDSVCVRIYVAVRYREERVIVRMAKLAKSRDRSLSQLVMEACVSYLSRHENRRS